jgi:hypothetical protein
MFQSLLQAVAELLRERDSKEFDGFQCIVKVRSGKMVYRVLSEFPLLRDLATGQKRTPVSG